MLSFMIAGLAISSCNRHEPKHTESSAQPAAAFFPTVVPGGIDGGRIYLAIPLLGDESRGKEEKQKAKEAFFDKAVPKMEKWSQDVPIESLPEGYGGSIIPDRFVDLKYVEANTNYKVGQSLKMRMSGGVVPIRIVKHEIHFAFASGDLFLYAVAEPVNGALPARDSEHVLAA